MLRAQLDNVKLPIGNCVLQRDESGAQLILSNQKSFSITLPESCILETLIQKEESISTKEELVIAAWGNPDIIGPNSLPVAITNLRKVLELDSIKIVNVPRKGYKLHIPEFETSLDPPKPIKSLHSNHFKRTSNNYLRLYQWALVVLSSTTLSVLIISYFYFWHTFDIVNVNVNKQSSQICLAKKDELKFIILASQNNLVYQPLESYHTNP
ncbi:MULTISPECIES: winged helix-turn-helix domain-containing protein [Vibrio]|jgi:DNA-binding winged helix-turn-helix (wHTH) protein|uniref:Winged helix-turn-helix domain-containing protein n=1 Tax=Vibrio qingdaonensis TaxID=2829491 RepID=A0A9X3HY59_9VIBR|nr:MULTISPECIES: winged helix-turn-helix domain-containing protein [Vibrio]MCW8348201.1 winged helix-turn-helix domain-containing protein [Vibrio qingdaonensis]NOH77383.1 winged helix-turn-helix transcriptional regulator [Vibrio crassostreae]NOI87893.1 winged helix-turn-helix transcriptional regulator [Vibrio sp. 99K-1]NOI96715.1 winged helix-turn-helix transcriptional regulator [Vibrio sp. T3Y01]CAK2482675.1 Winged helix-turn-helix transcriptional regulator [Vibrio crassostreae]